MIAAVAQRLWKAPDIELRTAAPPLAVLAGALTLYVALRYILIAIAFGPPTGCLVLDVLAFAAAGSLSGIRYGEIPALLHPLLGGIGVVVLVQVAFDGAALLHGLRHADRQNSWRPVSKTIERVAAPSRRLTKRRAAEVARPQ